MAAAAPCRMRHQSVAANVLQGREREVAMGSQGGGCGAGSLALGVLARLLTCLHLLYEVRCGSCLSMCAERQCSVPT
jgi:hypothetical protein